MDTGSSIREEGDLQKVVCRKFNATLCKLAKYYLP